ncbi:MAG: ADP-ribosylglycohydrolase family protein [Spirochaetota bacterium]|nr:ADP-ribosylglycohydrolase family protein [Spirochaetota bacterium]
MKDKIKGILIGNILGDSLGTSLNGLSRGHIKSIYKEIVAYPDPIPALKGKINKWRKPGLYSSLTQMMIIFSSILNISPKRKISIFLKYIKNCPQIGGCEYGIFRHPGHMERNLIKRIYSTDKREEISEFTSPCARLIPVIIPGLLDNSIPQIQFISNIITFSQVFNRNIATTAATLAFATILRRLLYDKYVSKLIPIAIEEINILQGVIMDNSLLIDEQIIDVHSLKDSLASFNKIFNEIEAIEVKECAEEIICKHVNRSLKTPIKRATVNNPLSIVPYAIYLAGIQLEDPSTALFSSLHEGGSTSVLCSLTGIIMGTILGTSWLPNNLVQGLVNRKQILYIVESIASRNVTDSMILDFVQSEVSLTTKEIEELNAKMKHWKPNVKTHKTKKDQEKELTQHVVESWTKLDKSKWKREKRRNISKT